ncbi:MAG: PDZ domain-containing protein, partial [Synergistes sp.]|nr:PDZ domain-containing protein [Synergistes sp.]
MKKFLVLALSALMALTASQAFAVSLSTAAAAKNTAVSAKKTADKVVKLENASDKKLGLVVTNEGKDGFHVVKDVEIGSAAESANIVINDIIHEIDGEPLTKLEKTAITEYLENKWASGTSLTLLVEHDGVKNLIT